MKNTKSLKKTVVFIGLLILLISCVEAKKSIYELERESLATGVTIDTITNRFFFGMTREQVESAIYVSSIKDDFYFNIEEISSLPFKVIPDFYNDSLYNISFISFQEAYMYDRVFSLYNLKHGDPDTIIIDKDGIENYWFKGNLKIKLEKNDREGDPINWVSVEYRDMRRNTIDRTLIRSTLNDDYFTPEYYDRYRDSKIKSLDDI